MFTTRFEAWVRRHAEALITALGRTPLTPNQVTVVGLALTFVAAGLGGRQVRWAGVVLIFSGHRDILDGALRAPPSYPTGVSRLHIDRYSRCRLPGAGGLLRHDRPAAAGVADPRHSRARGSFL